MNTELKEKMQEAAQEFAKADTENWQEYERNLVGSIQVKAFRAGSAAMYAELSPLVEWVSVEDRLPEPENFVIVRGNASEEDEGYIGKYEYSICEFSAITNEFRICLKVSHWRKIES